MTIDTSGAGTAGYPGASGQFVNGNQIPNVNATVYTPSSSVYPPVAATVTADAPLLTYRGAVMYLPNGCQINDILVDVGTAISVNTGGGATLTAAVINIGNAFNGTQYGSVTLTVAANAVTAGRYQPTFTGAQLNAIQSTTTDFTNPTGLVSPASFSQVVFTITIPYTAGTGTTLPTITAGTFTFAMRYTQIDPNIGNSTTYPYGNFD